MAFVETKDGTRLFYREHGQGKPILFVHSLSANSRLWEYQFAAFSERYRTIGFDRRGHGRSDIPASGYDADTLADDLARVIEVLDLRDVTLVGHSMGCCEIARYLSRYGSGRVARAVLLAPTTPFLLRTADNPNGVPAEAFEALRAEWRKDYPKWIADNAAAFFVPDTSPAMMQWGIAMLQEIALPVALACNRMMATTDFRGDLKRIDIPVLVLHGDKDVSAPLALTGEPTAALLRHGRLKVIEGAPHGLIYTHMEQVNADIFEFLKS